eukprot:TRINITY_DN11026_c0_g1_i1.p1 TRINITY_DN11026_c0_g1~~TRINITY_DN11026_c0_g1_i1.p1  ORF type:complete len:256 (+),score=41.13 TRINITY_DN11026_c0_g1_i1:28-768(+)
MLNGGRDTSDSESSEDDVPLISLNKAPTRVHGHAHVPVHGHAPVPVRAHVRAPAQVVRRHPKPHRPQKHVSFSSSSNGSKSTPSLSSSSSYPRASYSSSSSSSSSTRRDKRKRPAPVHPPLDDSSDDDDTPLVPRKKGLFFTTSPDSHKSRLVITRKGLQKKAAPNLAPMSEFINDFSGSDQGDDDPDEESSDMRDSDSDMPNGRKRKVTKKTGSRRPAKTKKTAVPGKTSTNCPGNKTEKGRANL